MSIVFPGINGIPLAWLDVALSNAEEMGMADLV
jgi:hypothetical protein